MVIATTTTDGVDMNDGSQLLKAAQRLDQPGAWHRGGFTGPDGSVCLVQSVAEAEGNRYSQRMSDENFAAVNHALRFSPYYHALKLVCRYLDDDPQEAVMSWNDAKWRRRSSVVRVLRGSATYAHETFAINDRIRLQMEVERLKRELAAAVARISELEKENASLLRRVANMRAMRREIAMFDDLDRELDAVTRELQDTHA